MGTTQTARQPRPALPRFQPANGATPTANRRPVQSDKAVARRRALAAMPRVQLECRVGRHDFPKVIFSETVPWNLQYVPDGRGVFRMIHVCAHGCGVYRWRHTLRGGRWNRDEVWRYHYPGDWLKLGTDLDMDRAEVVETYWDGQVDATLAARTVTEVVLAR